LANVSVLLVLGICVQLVPPLVEDSHLTITPLMPFTVKVPPFALAHAVVVCGEMVAPAGPGITDTVTLAVLEHPFAPVPVTVYVVVVAGLPVTVDPMAEARPVEGLQI
jgi:hypothetical protein